MKTSVTYPPPDWPQLLSRLRGDLAALDATEHSWLVSRVKLIGKLQEELNSLFLSAGGTSACAICNGACCGCGRHHFTLTNLVGYLLDGLEPPVPDFSLPCPFLGEAGCLLPVARRPYNCITFFCEILDARLDEPGQSRLLELDRRLRSIYEEVAERYPLASLRGIWIALKQIGPDRVLITRT